MAKSDAIMRAIGDVDEANSSIGVARAAIGDDPLSAALERIQNDLFDLGADVATPADMEGALRILPEQVAWMEREIDRLNTGLEPLRSFVLPGGDAGAAALYLARAVVRRAERTLVEARASAEISAECTRYLNRLSDFLFVAARSVNKSRGGDVLWQPGASRERVDPG